MPISLNKLVPYSDEPINSSIDHHSISINHSSQMEPSNNKNSDSSKFSLRKLPSKFRKNCGKMIMKSYRIRSFSRNREDGRNFSGNSRKFCHNLPIRIRPAFCIFTLITLIILIVIWFHPSIHESVPIPNKLFHFFGFAIITSLFYSIPEVEDQSRVIWYWNYFNEILTGFVCFFLGGFLTEIIQLVIPWKSFSWGDLLSNQLGCLVGYKLSETLNRQYRHRLELSRLYEPLNSNRGIELTSSDEEEDDYDQIGGGGGLESLRGAEAAFGGGRSGGLNGRNELSNVWSDQFEVEVEYFNFNEETGEEQGN